jgi:hypothetical protein
MNCPDLPLASKCSIASVRSPLQRLHHIQAGKRPASAKYLSMCSEFFSMVLNRRSLKGPTFVVGEPAVSLSKNSGIAKGPKSGVALRHSLCVGLEAGVDEG